MTLLILKYELNRIFCHIIYSYKMQVCIHFLHIVDWQHKLFISLQPRSGEIYYLKSITLVRQLTVKPPVKLKHRLINTTETKVSSGSLH